MLAGTVTADGPLSAYQITDYRQNGFVVVPGAIQPDLLADLTAAADEFARRAETSVDASIIELDEAAGAATGTPRIRRIKSPHLHHRAFAAALANQTLLNMVTQLIGPDIRWHHTKLNAKQPGGSGHVEWHTDWGYYPHTNADLLEIAVAIDPSTEENGCLRVLPGSHLGPALDHSERGVFVGAVAPGSFDADATVPLLLDRGDISIHHVRLLHGSGPNRTGGQRRLLLQGYAATDAWPLMAQHQPDDWPAWDKRILRGVPTTEARMDGSPVRIPLPLAPAMGLFETQRQMSSSHFGAESEPLNRGVG